MAYEFRFRRRVEFSETDMAGIVHFANFFRYMESAEHAFFRSLGYSIHTDLGQRHVGWPRVDVQCRFHKPLKFEDEFEVHLLVREKRAKSITYDFVFRLLPFDEHEEAEGSREIAHGSITVVCVEQDETGRMRAVAIPEEIDKVIEVAPQPLARQGS